MTDESLSVGKASTHWKSPSIGDDRQPRVRLAIGGVRGVVFTFRGRLPNRWCRLWQRMFLGFVWTEVPDDRNLPIPD